MAFPFPSFLRAGLLLLSAVFSAGANAELREDYLRGYVEAVLEVRFPEHPIKVRQVRDDGHVWLGCPALLDVAQQHAVEEVLLATQKIRHVSWRTDDDCAGPISEEFRPRLKVAPLPTGELFRPLIADPRQPQFSVKYHAYETPSDSFNAASVSFGDYFGFIEGLFGESGLSQLGIQGAVFAVFNLDADSFDLVNADYWIGFPATYRRGPWSFLGRIYHQSSHLGDEFLLGNPGINRINLSYEDLEIIGSYDWKRWRLYGGGGVILHSQPDLDPWHGQAGVEYRAPNFWQDWDLVGAADIQGSEENNWRLNRSYQIGFAFEGPNNREVRLMLEHFRGLSPNGQFYKDRLRYTGLGIYFDL